MMLLTWNQRGGGPAARQYLDELDVDVGFVQEATLERLPAAAVWDGPARRKSGRIQPWGSAIIPRRVRG